MGQVFQVLQGAPKVKEGDKVVVNLDENIVRPMQFQHGGWAKGMLNYLGKKGKVNKIDSDGDVTVKYKDGIIIVYNPDIVAKILSEGDTVKITDNEEKAKFLLMRHGGWNPRMKGILGEEVKVKEICSNYDVIVKIDDDIWRLNPLLCTVINKDSDGLSSSDDDDSDMIMKMFGMSTKRSMEYLLYTDLFRRRDGIDFPLDDLSLHMSVYQENEEITKYLLDNGLDVNKTDNDGDTALHLAVIKKNPKIIRLLVRKDADLNILNKNKLAPIHIAVWTGTLECVKELKDCDINIKDKDGDTPLMLATMKKEHDMLEHILTYKEVDLTHKNENSWAAIHSAAKNGDVKSLEMLLEKKPDIVDMQKIDGFSALHLVALNDCLEAAKFLIQKAKAKLDTRTLDEETPLLLAARQKHFEMIKLLVSEGADVNAQNDDGNTSLHLTFNKKIRPEIFLAMFTKVSFTNTSDGEKIAIYLVENGASLSIQNKEKKTPLDMITDDKLKANLQKREKKSRHVQVEMSCLICTEITKLVQFQPCGHMKLCVNCNEANIKAKICMECKTVITGRIEPEIQENLKRLFKLGDRVCIKMNREAMENPNGKELFKKTGIVTKIDEGATIYVKFEDREDKILPEMLTKVFSFGDEVKVIDNLKLVKNMQKRHAEWTDEMKEIIGKTGRVVQEGETMTFTVKFNSKLYSLNPLVCVLQSKQKQKTANDDQKNCCVKCGKKTDEMLLLQCGHMYCSECKYLRKCNVC